MSRKQLTHSGLRVWRWTSTAESGDMAWDLSGIAVASPAMARKRICGFMLIGSCGLDRTGARGGRNVVVPTKYRGPDLNGGCEESDGEYLSRFIQDLFGPGYLPTVSILRSRGYKPLYRCKTTAPKKRYHARLAYRVLSDDLIRSWVSDILFFFRQP